MMSAMTKRAPESLKVALCGACLAGNMGGPALNISMIESIERLVGDVRVTLLSKYPVDDRERCEELGWRMEPFPSVTQLFWGVPFSIIYGLLRLLRLPRKWLARGPFSAYLDNDLLIDLSGISFSDDRSLSGLVINSLWLLPAVATGIPWVKASQAMGPFSKPLVRIAARFFLSRAAVLVARGASSERFLRALLPESRIYRLPDVAFALHPAPESTVEEALVSAGIEPGEKYCVVGPSYVVDALMAKEAGVGVYPSLMARVVDELVELSGSKVLLLPHARATTGSSFDDLNVCEEAFAQVRNPEMVRVLPEHLSASVLKGIISRGEVAVGSRFHFMVAAISSGVPAVAVAWSHKYEEMMQDLGLERFAMGHEGLVQEALLDKVKELWGDRAAVRRGIAERLPEVKRQAEANARIAVEVLGYRC